MKGNVKRAPGGVARGFVGVRLSPAARGEVEVLAAQEAEGNLSEMLRRLLAEALQERNRRGSARRSA